MIPGKTRVKVFFSNVLLCILLSLVNIREARADLAAIFAAIGIDLAGRALEAANSAGKEVVIAAAKTRLESDQGGDTGTFGGISVTAEADKGGDHAKTVSTANANLITKLFPNIATVNPVADMVGDPDGLSIAAGYARAGTQTRLRSSIGASLALPSSTVALSSEVLLPLELDLNINLNSSGSPASVALSVNDLSDTQFDSRLGVDPLLASELSSLSLQPAIPLTSYFALTASLDATGVVQALAVDLYGNVLLTGADFTSGASGGMASASYSGTLSTIINLPLETLFRINIEDVGRAQMQAVPEPSSLFLLGMGILGLLAFGRARRHGAGAHSQGVSATIQAR